MEQQIIDLSEEQMEMIDRQLYEYDQNHIKYRLEGCVHLGYVLEGRLIGGLNAYMSAFRILYVDTVFVQEEYRMQGIGRKLIEVMEKRAKELGANTIRLDTFNWQGYHFYKRLGFKEVGHYANEEDGYEEYFFLKRI